jgi:Zn-dependent protease
LRSWQIFKIWGIPFKIHPYWFAVLFLFSFSISNQVNLTSGDQYNTKEAWIIGFSTSFLLLSSIIAHEVFHTFVSLNQGVKIKKITFYFLGSILQIDKYCQTALGNIKIAIVRPLLCFTTAFVLLLITNYSESQELIAINIISRVGLLNLFLGFLNLIPISFLDGGNLLKSIIWHFSGSKNKGRNFLNKVNLFLSFSALIFGIICLFSFNFYYGFILSLLGLFGVNSSKSESQMFKIEEILKFSKVSELKLKPLRKIEYDSNFAEFNALLKNKKDAADKYFFVANNGRWTGFVEDNLLKTISIKKWDRSYVGDFQKPINSFASLYNNCKLWQIIERLEETSEGFILVVNSADIPLGIIDRAKIGQFVLIKLGFNFPSEIINKFNNKNHYPLGIELPRIINSMKQKGDL